jgi:hypothetical protein
VSGSAKVLLGVPTAARRRRTGDGRGMGGSPARGRRRGTTATGERRGGRGGGPGDAASVGTAARSARQSGRRRRARGGALSGVRRGGLSGRVARCPDSSFKPRATARCVAATRQQRATAWAQCGARRLTGGVRSSVIFELKFTPDENSSK